MITTKQHVYLLKFRNSSESFIFQTEEQFLKILKLQNTKHGIEGIKILNSKMKIIYLSRKRFRQYFNHNTEITEILNKIRF